VDRARGASPATQVLTIALVLAVCVAVAAAVQALPHASAGGPAFQVGVTHGEQSADGWNPTASVERARTVLKAVAPLQNQSLMGWGALNPEPSPGTWDWSSLDARIQLITATGARPVLTLCCAPDWMKGGPAGSTDWTRLGVAPTPDHYADFARLAAAAAQRYPQVRDFLVWNELKGFYDAARDDWDVAAYTDLYNQVYRAVKRVRPDARIGGPYVVFDSWSSASTSSHPSTVHGPWGVLDQRPLDVVTYWLKHAVGADFIAVDAVTSTRDRGLITTDFASVAKLAAVTHWVRSRTRLPIWWAEIYANASGATGSADPRAAAVLTDALVTVAQAGASVALIWQPQESPNLRSPALFTSTASTDGGRALPLVGMLDHLEGPLADDPRSITMSTDRAGSRWSLATAGSRISWSLTSGLSVQDTAPGAPPQAGG
jgi:hypothetical protein